MKSKLLLPLRSAQTMGLQILGVAGSFGLTVALTRTLSLHDFGALAIAQSILSLLAIIATLGLGQASMRFVAEYRNGSHSATLHTYVRWSVRTVLWVSLGVGSVATCAAWSLSPQFSESSGLLVLLVALPPVCLIGLGRGVLVGADRSALAELLSKVLRPIFALVALWIVVAVSHSPMSANSAAIAILAGSVVTAGVILWQSTVQLRFASPQPKLEPSSSQNQRAWLRTSIPLLFTTAVFVLLNRTDILLLGAIDSVEEAGRYSIGVQVASLLGFPLIASQLVATKQIASCFKAGDTKELAKLTQRVAIQSGLASTAMLGAMMSLAWLLPVIFGDAYAGLGPILFILGLTFAVAAWMGPTGKLMAMTGLERRQLVLVASAALANAILGLAIIPLYGAIGAAMSTLMATIIWKCGAAVSVRKSHGFTPPFKIRNTPS